MILLRRYMQVKGDLPCPLETVIPEELMMKLRLKMVEINNKVRQQHKDRYMETRVRYLQRINDECLFDLSRRYASLSIPIGK